MRSLLCLLVVGFVVSLSNSVIGGEYLVYKVVFKINRFVKNTSTEEWEFDKKNDQLRFGGYFIFQKGYGIDADNYPARIINFKTKQKYYPAKYDAGTNSYIADTSQKVTNKFVVYPYSVEWPTSKVTTLKENYNNTEANNYYFFGGEWSTVDIKRSTQNKTVLALLDFYSNDKALLATREYQERIQNGEIPKEIVFDDVIGYSEAYSGWVNKHAIATSLGGNLNIDMTNTVYKSKQITLRYNSAITKRALTGSEKNMRDAVNSVVSYLKTKGYASTWAE